MDKWLNNKNAVRVISVILALIIWSIVHLDTSNSPQSVTSNVDTKVIEAVPITVSGLDPERYILTAMEPTVVRLVVEGRISSLFTANNSDYIVKLDLSNVKSGMHELPLTVSLPKGVTEVELSPRIVMVQIEELETRTVEVEIMTEGTPAEGYILGKSQFTGENGNVVEITMPQDDFSRLEKVAVVVDVTGANANVEDKRAKIEAYDGQGKIINNVKFNPETLSVQTEITLPSKDVPIQLRYTGQLPNDYSISSITTDVETVKIYGFQNQLDLIDVFDGAIVDLSKLTQSGQITVKLNELEGIAKIEPTEIPVNIEIETSQQRVLEKIPINVTGLPEGHKLIIKEAPDMKMNVPIKGAPLLVSRIRNSDVVLTLDVTNLEAGEHEVSLTAELPAYIVTSMVDGFSYNVNIEIIREEAVNTDTEVSTDITPQDDENGQLPSNEEQE